MPTEQRMIAGFMEAGALTRGYIKTHTLDDSDPPQEIQSPRDVELTPAQVEAFNAALPGILAAE